MGDPPAPVQQLEALWARDFPLTRAMGMEVVSLANHVLTTRSSLEPNNTNTHGTAFGGSLYAIQALTAWSLLWLEMQAAGLSGSIIHARGSIEFVRTVREDIVAVADFSNHAEVLNRLARDGKVRTSLATAVHAEGELASRFEGDYTARLTR
ncbi:MAG: YiiD C-terminal domain-containing protein [Pseudomonadales bacterium]